MNSRGFDASRGSVPHADLRLTVRRALLALALVVAAVFGTGEPSSAHSPTGGYTCDAGHSTFLGNCWRHWSFAQAKWRWGGGWPDTQHHTPIVNAIATWESGHALDFQFDNSLSTPNYINWALNQPCAGGSPACVSRTISGDHIVTWIAHFQPHPWYLGTGGHGYSGGLDLRSAATHELGHTFGLGESQLGNTQHECAGSGVDEGGIRTMTQVGCLAGGHTERRSLHADDVLGRCEVYKHAHNYAC